ncbi:MAG: hypothetical protein IPI11_00365 [Haliscomenobacter sp.]|nr:hypothetical protein [Haliscomenobacter sp.]
MKGMILGVLAFVLAQVPMSAQYGAMTLSVGQGSGKTGSTVCVNLNATALRRIISMQYSLKWDSNALEFVQVRNFRLPGLAQENFGQTKTKEGILTFAWIDNSLKGVDLPDGTPLYQICFKIKGKAGSAATISLSPKPTPYEVINTFEQYIQLVGVSGKVVVKG